MCKYSHGISHKLWSDITQKPALWSWPLRCSAILIAFKIRSISRNLFILNRYVSTCVLAKSTIPSSYHITIWFQTTTFFTMTMPMTACQWQQWNYVEDLLDGYFLNLYLKIALWSMGSIVGNLNWLNKIIHSSNC